MAELVLHRLDGETELDIALECLDVTTDAWRSELGEVPTEHMTYQARTGGHSIVTVLLHMIAVEEWWIQDVAGGVPMDESRRRELLDDQTNQDDGVWPVPPPMSLKSLIDMQDATRRKTREVVQRIGDLNAISGFDSEDRHYEYNLRWILYHVAEHEAWHGGQLLLLSDLATAHESSQA